MKLATIDALADAAAARRPVAFAKRLSDAAEFLLPDASAPAALNEAGRQVLAEDKTGTVTIGDEDWFIEARNPPPRLILVGAVHIAQSLGAARRHGRFRRRAGRPAPRLRQPGALSRRGHQQ